MHIDIHIGKYICIYMILMCNIFMCKLTYLYVYCIYKITINLPRNIKLDISITKKKVLKYSENRITF